MHLDSLYLLHYFHSVACISRSGSQYRPTTRASYTLPFSKNVTFVASFLTYAVSIISFKGSCCFVFFTDPLARHYRTIWKKEFMNLEPFFQYFINYSWETYWFIGFFLSSLPVDSLIFLDFHHQSWWLFFWPWLAQLVILFYHTILFSILRIHPLTDVVVMLFWISGIFIWCILITCHFLSSSKGKTQWHQKMTLI